MRIKPEKYRCASAICPAGTAASPSTLETALGELKGPQRGRLQMLQGAMGPHIHACKSRLQDLQDIAVSHDDDHPTTWTQNFVRLHFLDHAPRSLLHARNRLGAKLRVSRALRIVHPHIVVALVRLACQLRKGSR